VHFRSVLARAARLGLLLAAVSTVAACSASVSTKAKEADDGWEDRQPPPAGPERGPAQRAISGRPPTATFPGYRVLDDDRHNSVVMVEVSRDVDVAQQQAEGRLVYVLRNTNVPEKVNRLPLVADHFGTAVSRIFLEQAGNDAFLIIETRAPVQAQHRVVQTDNGINVEIRINGAPFDRTEVRTR
jgi:hypothetical protein